MSCVLKILILSGLVLGVAGSAIPSAFGAFRLESSHQKVSGSLRILDDPSSTLSLADAKLRLAEFRSLSGNSANLGWRKHPVWAYLEIENTSNESDWIGEFTYANLDEIDVYASVSSGKQFEFQLGRDRPFRNRSVYYRNPNFSLHLEKGQTASILIRLASVGPIDSTLNLTSEREFGDHASSESAFFGTYYGLLFAMVFFNLLVFAVTRERVYGLYVGFLVGYSIFQLFLNGFFAQWFVSGPMGYLKSLLILSFYLGAAAGLAFAHDLLGLKSLSKGRYRLFLGYLYFHPIAALLGLVLPYSIMIRVAVVDGLLFSLVQLLLGLASLRASPRLARLYLLSSLMFIVGGVTYAFKTQGYLPSIWLTNYSMQIGSAVQMMLLALGLGGLMAQDELSQDLAAAELVKVEERLNVELKSRVFLFSDIVHHLNNPLNYARGGAIVLNAEYKRLESWLLGAVEGDSTEIDGTLKGIELNRRQLEGALGSMAEAVDELRGVSGLDGNSLAPIPLSIIFDLANERLQKSLQMAGQGIVPLVYDSMTFRMNSVVGNRHLNSVAVEMACLALLGKNGARDSLKLMAHLASADPDRPGFVLIEIQQIADGSDEVIYDPEKLAGEIREQIALISEAYGAGVHVDENGAVVLSLCIDFRVLENVRAVLS